MEKHTAARINPVFAALSTVFAIALVPITFIAVLYIQILTTGCCGAPTPTPAQSAEEALGTLLAIAAALVLSVYALYQGWKKR